MHSLIGVKELAKDTYKSWNVKRRTWIV